MGRVDVERIPYDEYSNRQLAAVPLAVLAVALLIIGGAYVLTGTPVDLGIEFTGGTELRFDAGGASDAEVRETFSEVEIENLRSVGNERELVVGPDVDSERLETLAEDAGYDVLSIESRSANFGADAQQQAIIGLTIAFVGMSVLVALIFRTFVPSLAIVASAFSDIAIPIALMNVLGIDLTLGAVAALLMLIGYSVDSDILLNNHVLRRHGGFYESSYRAMRTGVSMTLTSISAMTTMAIVAWLFGIELMFDIALILVFGLSADLLNTYMLNMSLLRWYKYEGVAK
ncbi:MAG: preprotein translocase subunit SecF [Halobacteriales archaeon SW_8_66_22]|nr:MAG: preprotein translocase subunit SecF [Halobacteriales archaeon SW_8_66_22]